MAFECCEIIDMQEACDMSEELFERVGKSEETLSAFREKGEASDVFSEIASLYNNLGLTEEMLDDEVNVGFGETVWDTVSWDGNIELQLSFVEFFLVMIEKDMLRKMHQEEQRIYGELEELGMLKDF